jgi:hypothetical protein
MARSLAKDHRYPFLTEIGIDAESREKLGLVCKDAALGAIPLGRPKWPEAQQKITDFPS